MKEKTKKIEQQSTQSAEDIQQDKNLITKLKSYYDLCLQFYNKDHKKMRLLDATDRGDLWRALRTQFPTYQILPDTNHVSYVKNNLLASIYTVEKSAQLLPTSEKDKSIVMNLNIALDCVWNLGNVGYYQFQAGERAALMNMGVTQVGWSEKLTAGSGDSFYKGNVTFKNINPLKFMRDPFANDLESSGYCMTFDNYHKSVFEQNDDYKEEFKKYIAQKPFAASSQEFPQNDNTPAKVGQKDYHDLIIYWTKENNKVDEIHVINNEHILFKKKDIKPGEFPFADLYCNMPAEALVGTSEPAKIFANTVAYNLLDSITLTAEYKNQRPPKFISSQSGLNIQQFAKHGDEADRTFVVNGKASDAVHYHEFPQVGPLMSAMKVGLQKDIQLISGIDGRYTGRDTGSIITTGGTEEMLNRVTIIDTPKIKTYENYTKRLTKLVLMNLLEYAPKRKYFYQKPGTTQWLTATVDFPAIDSNTLFNYAINISSELPKNKQRLSAMANMLMEKQMQYQQEGASVQLITEEEWLMYQDLPNKEFMLERMGVQRMNDSTEEVSQVLFQYANLIKNGMKPDDAILATAESLKNKRMGVMPEAGPVPPAVADSVLPPADQPPMM